MIEKLQMEHDSDNEIYISAKTGNMENLETPANERLNKLLLKMKSIDISGNYVETLDLFVSFFDDVILECAELTFRRKEIEEEIIGYCKEIIKKPTASGTRNIISEHVTAKLVDCLNEQPSAKVSQEMAAVILDETNPLRFGFTFYERFCKNNALFTDVDSLDYLETEVEVRKNLILGNDNETFNALERLLKLPVDTPEKYLLISLNSFYHGFEQDAVRAITIGLSRFPGNERLLSAQSAIAG